MNAVLLRPGNSINGYTDFNLAATDFDLAFGACAVYAGYTRYEWSASSRGTQETYLVSIAARH